MSDEIKISAEAERLIDALPVGGKADSVIAIRAHIACLVFEVTDLKAKIATSESDRLQLQDALTSAQMRVDSLMIAAKDRVAQLEAENYKLSVKIIQLEDGVDYCKKCGSTNIIYDPNPHGLPVIKQCQFGADLTGEPGAEKCADCDSLEIGVRKAT